MPWKIEDVDRHKKGLSEGDKKKWIQEANGILASCTKKGGDVLDCEVVAIRTANGSFSNDKMSAQEYADKPNALNLEDHNTTLDLAIGEVDEGDYQLVFPRGTFQTGKYGEINVSKTYISTIVDNWKKLGSNSTYLDKDHEFGESYGWPEDIIADEAGVKVKWNFNDAGKELIKDKRYKFYSAAIGYRRDIETGEELFPCLPAVTLCNTPVMSSMPGVHLADSLTHRDKDTHIQEGHTMTLSEIMDAIKALSDEERKTITEGNRTDVAGVFGIDVSAHADTELSEAKKKAGVQDEKIKLILSENQSMGAELKTLRGEKQTESMNKVVEAAIKEGKILPKNKEQWKGLYSKDPEGTEELLKVKGSEVDLGEVGTGSTGLNANEEDKQAAKLAGMELSEYMELTYEGGE